MTEIAKPTLPGRIVTEATIVCPECGHARSERMPTDACQFFYECVNCKVLLRPKPGDCCVFCSYGSAPCPPKQVSGGCCADAETDSAEFASEGSDE